MKINNYFIKKSFSYFIKTKILQRNRNYNFYEVLGVEKTSTNEQIRSAYLKLAKQYHPDMNNDEGAEEKFKSITTAYEALNNQRNRDLYDAYMYSDPYSDQNYNMNNDSEEKETDEERFYKEKARWSKFSEQFKSKKSTDGGFWGREEKGKENYEEEIFKDFNNIFNNGFKTKKAKGEDIYAEIKISFEEAFNGVIKGIKIPNRREICVDCKGSRSSPGFRPSKCFTCAGTGETRSSVFGSTKCNMCKGNGFIIKNPCKTCKGQGVFERSVIEAVDIPNGVKSETVLNVNGKGHCSGNIKQANGDLFIKVIVEDSNKYKREGDNLIYELQLTLKEAIYGIEKEIPVLFHNKTQLLKIPKETQPNSEFKIAGCGFVKTSVDGSGSGSLIRGDQITKIRVLIPSISLLNNVEKEDFMRILSKL
jgi:molecular chaperone DnaJ